MNTLKTLNRIAQETFSEYGFTTCSEYQQTEIVKILIRNNKYRSWQSVTMTNCHDIMTYDTMTYSSIHTIQNKLINKYTLMKI